MSKKQITKHERNTMSVFPYEKMFTGGMCELGNDLFSTTMEFSDINYQTSSDEDQIAIFGKYMEICNSLGSNQGVELTLQNQMVDEEEFKKNVFLKYQDDGFDNYRDEMNQVFADNIKEGNNAISTRRFITYTTKEDNYDEAVKAIAQITSEYSSRFSNLGSSLRMLNGKERMDIIHTCLDPLSPLEWDYNENISSKQAIAPSGIDFSSKNMIEISTINGIRYEQTLFLKNYSTDINDKLLIDLSKIEHNFTLSFHMKVIDNADAVALVKMQIAKMEIQKQNEQKRALKAGYDPDMLPQELEYSYGEAKALLDDVQRRNQRLFNCQVIIMPNCSSVDELKEVVRKINNVARKHSTEFGILDYQQEEGFQAALPLGITYLPINRTLTTSVCAALIPFASQELLHKGEAFYYGVNALSHNLILCDRRELMNPSGWILGKPGAGKSFAAKREMISAVLANKKNEIIIIDPEREYGRIAELFNGSTITIDNKSNVYVNPLDGDITLEDGFVQAKAEFLQAMCSQIVGEKHINSKMESIIDRCARQLYERYQLDLQENEGRIKVKVPNFTDFYNLLKQQDNAEARDLVVSLELYVEGSNNLFAKDSNIDVHNRFTVYDINDLQKSMKPLGMLVILESLWDRIIRNKIAGKRTWIWIDEIYLLLRDSYCTNFFKELWKRARKYDAIITGITQNVEELLENTTVRTMLSNSEFILMLNQAANDRDELMSMLNISEEQSNFISNSEEGSGLLYNGKVLVAFKDRFPKGTSLYNAMTTKPEERKILDARI